MLTLSFVNRYLRGLVGRLINENDEPYDREEDEDDG